MAGLGVGSGLGLGSGLRSGFGLGSGLGSRSGLGLGSHSEHRYSISQENCGAQRGSVFPLKRS